MTLEKKKNDTGCLPCRQTVVDVALACKIRYKCAITVTFAIARRNLYCTLSDRLFIGTRAELNK